MSLRKQKTDSLLFHPFKDLKKNIEHKGLSIPAKIPLKKEPEISNEEALFRDAMSTVREISEFRKMPVRQRRRSPVNKRRSPENTALRALEKIVAGEKPIHLPDTQEFVQWNNAHVQADMTRMLHNGRHTIQDCLDLHGCTVDEAEMQIAHFLKEALQKRLKCIKIIHGRGLRSSNGPVLKALLVNLLSKKYRKHVVSFVSARPCDGGLGALYVLLK